MNRILRFHLLILILILIPLRGFCDVEDKDIGGIVNSVGEVIKSKYVFPEVAEEIAALIMKKYEDGLYNGLTSKKELAKRLTKDIRLVNEDKHLTVIFNPKRVSQIKEIELEPDSNDGDLPSEMLDFMRKENYGFKEIKILDGNIGYLDLRVFEETRWAGDTAVAAMNFLANTDSIIIDLRNNGGGAPSMIQLISSYFFEGDPVHLNDFYWRESNKTTQTWTLPYISGERDAEKDLYILTGEKTFSAAEEFTYNLKHLERATIVGQRTGGGAHPGGLEVVTDEFLVWTPSGRAINPITGTNWEGVGVTPDVEVSEKNALSKAIELAITKTSKTPPSD